MLGLWPRMRPKSDEEHVERLRRSLASFDRWRRPLLALHLAAAVTYVAAVIAAVWALRGFASMMGANAPGVAPGFLIGLAAGASLGFLGVKIAHGLVDLALGLRNERLLVRYHDALREMEQEAREAEEAETI
ncbi:hypothetical protein OJF2_41660 [Aquisphaera giovannonii]|uniref:Uncharacterized protein n=1 Tax=Aquisphaera giovannonii TaxID=406548 RepID=A0A5B9W503_9BACT|nr:hypothetical protein [Aquisphaera giovannonii]QEH35613.1 hypothetical protein OJF2_41660 [Aquisphaera giovannonii]